MPIGPMIDENAKSFEKMLDEGYADVKEAVLKLRAALGKYGFRGAIECKLDVHTIDEDGREEASASRSLKHKFKR